MRTNRVFSIVFLLGLAACVPLQQINKATPAPIFPPHSSPFPDPNPSIPDFEHIAIITFENREFSSVIGSADAPYLNQLVKDNVLLSQFYAVTHPSLPNYVAMVGGDTYGYKETCTNCPVDATNLADLMEVRGLSWRSYQESMPKHCALKDINDMYVAKHNPFLYYTSILNNVERCSEHVVDWDDFLEDVDEGNLPNFSFITPNMCSDGHECPLSTSDEWLANLLPSITESFQKDGDDWLVILTWDEGQTNESCCGLGEKGGGHIVTILVSPQAKSGFDDPTPYSTYSLLRTISEGWGLPLLGHAADESTNSIIAPWK